MAARSRILSVARSDAGGLGSWAVEPDWMRRKLWPILVAITVLTLVLISALVDGLA
jgi:hypothetical protein